LFERGHEPFVDLRDPQRVASEIEKIGVEADLVDA
jgi:hypothetical protein